MKMISDVLTIGSLCIQSMCIQSLCRSNQQRAREYNNVLSSLICIQAKCSSSTSAHIKYYCPVKTNIIGAESNIIGQSKHTDFKCQYQMQLHHIKYHWNKEHMDLKCKIKWQMMMMMMIMLNDNV